MKFAFPTLLLVALLPGLAPSALAKAGKDLAPPKKSLIPTEQDIAIKAGAPFDKNFNGKIDGSEVDALRAAFEKEPTGPLKGFDTDHNGKLDDVEIAAIRLPTAEKTKKEAAKKKKSSNPFDKGS